MSKLLREYVRERMLADESGPSANIMEARERWAGLILENGIADLREEANELHLMCEGQTVGDILAVFDDKAAGLDDKFKEIVGDIVNIVVSQAKALKPEMFEEVSEEDDPEEIAQALSEKLMTMGEKFKGMSQVYSQNTDSMGARKAAGKAFESDSGREALDIAKELKDNKMVQAVAKSAAGEGMKKLVMKIAEFIPFGKQVMDALKLVGSAVKIGGKLKGLFNKFKKSKASPQDKFADFAAKVARGPDQEMGDFASILQMNDDLEEVLDDRLEIKYVKDYVDKLRTAPVETPVEDIDINDLITKWIKEEENLADTELEVSV